ncbi:hypothetical protein BGZ61DRAFT_20791 [Ilyonectria robusta]|uniref:uncharacterized protein n=1 Tax=Ilyonectria robusta TaxID=1079257 RepID=UPI001E8DFE91|nr:uncharacterized protein BGZ61DRAFT_20791 [Ilyonectria robusta]KAH8737692.1 hypothetical protein BGZ61DRAFT_20791 [Ilyonectria robusta]
MSVSKRSGVDLLPQVQVPHNTLQFTSQVGGTETKTLVEHVFVFELTNTATTRQRAGTLCSKQACPCVREPPPGRILFPSARTRVPASHAAGPKGPGCRVIPARQAPDQPTCGPPNSPWAGLSRSELHRRARSEGFCSEMKATISLGRSSP